MEKPQIKKRFLGKLFKWTITVLIILIISLFAIPSIFNDVISNEIKKGINKNIETELQFKDSNISFFNHFPSLTFSFKDVNLISAKPFEKDDLISAKELGFGINIFKLIFSDKVVINETYITDATINLNKDKFGRSNYDVLIATDTTTTTVKDTSTTSLNLNLKQLNISNATVLYKDDAIGISIISKGLNYHGKGGLDDGKLELGSKLDITSIDVIFDNIDYLNGKKLRAKSFTIYDTKNLSIALDKNTIALNDLDVNFHGKLDMFENGLAYDLRFNTEHGTLKNMVSALPPKYAEWSKNVTLDGDFDATMRLAGFTGSVPKSSEIANTSLDVNVYNGTIKHKDANEAIENLYLKFKSDFEGDYMTMNLDSLDFILNKEKTSGKMLAYGKADSLYIKSNIKSDINLNTLNQTLNLPDLNFNGVLMANIAIDGVYQPNQSLFPKTNGTLSLSNGLLQTSGHPEPIKNIEISAKLLNEGKSYTESSLIINTLNFKFLDNQFTSHGTFKNFDNLEYLIKGKGDIDFTTLNQVVALPILITKGQLTADLNLKGQLNNPQNINNHSGTLNLNNITLNSAELQQPINIKEGQFLFLNDRMAISNLNVNHQSSDMVMNGYFQNYLDYTLYNNGILKGDLSLKSSKIDITEFFPKQEHLNQSSDSLASSNTIENVVSGVMPVPKDLDLTIQIEIDTLQYNQLNITKLSGNLGVKEQGLFLKDSHLQMVDGTASLNGFYQPTAIDEALFAMNLKADNLNIEKSYNSIDLFRELAPAAAQASGILSADYNLTGIIDQQMLPVLPALKGKGTVKVHSVQFDGYKLLGKVSEKSGFEALNDPKISEITINSTINNNVIALEQFKFKVSPFRLRVEGQTTFDSALSLKMRIGLPPLGIIGIPVVVEGKSDDFDIKLGKKSSDLDTLETSKESYTEEDIERMSTIKDSIRVEKSIDAISKMQVEMQSSLQDSLKTKAIDTLKIQNRD
ncbi:AsmA-like C-terminal region-containing protein [Winogradskyella vidalii]|uniref:AsmA-like C-terminal region-containing protein n=1 Tax=Winogradskyella vidalii TaxID=2615024 RepID=UPI0015C86D85|nr:AsmA-like C-terminal region-containing protein [Winogradskyella vidalii]